MGREEGLAVLLEVTFGCGDKAIDPREKFFGTVVSVEDDRYAVLLGEGADVECSRDGTCNCGSVVGVIKVFSCIKL